MGRETGRSILDDAAAVILLAVLAAIAGAFFLLRDDPSPSMGAPAASEDLTSAADAPEATDPLGNAPVSLLPLSEPTAVLEQSVPVQDPPDEPGEEIMTRSRP
jgi:hypothetical protein